MRLIAPMLATPGELPEEMDGGWAAEMKYDGCRLLGAVGGGEPPVLWTRNLNVVTSSYPEVAEALTDVFGGRGRIVFDGEVVALAQGRPSFARLQKRMNTLRPTTALRRQVPVTYLPFDVLSADGSDLMAAPYLERRAALTDLGHQLHGRRRSRADLTALGRMEGAVILEAAQQFRVWKARFSNGCHRPYLPGQRTRSWRKVLTPHEELLLDCWLDSRAGVHSATWSAHSSSAPTMTRAFFATWAMSGPASRWPCAAS